ncbi:MAG: hypothetical protein JO326_14515, partial [Acetobacteraceae bacterium]|nr:hypothetical protein [Acetobacteraceae bacterium]
VPAKHRGKLFYTTNLAKRMPDAYFAALARSGVHHLNVSLESFVPAIYEAMRAGARHRIFVENWDKMLAAFAACSAPPRLRYNIMAYRSNLREIPGMVSVLLRDKMAWQVEVRHTFDEPHIPPEFREREFLSTAEWAWLAEALSHHAPEQVLLLLPPAGVGHDRPGEAAPGAALVGRGLDPAPPSDATAVGSAPDGRAYERIPKPLNLSMDWDGTLRVYGEQPREAGQPPSHVNYVMTNINYLKDPLRFLLTL